MTNSSDLPFLGMRRESRESGRRSWSSWRYLRRGVWRGGRLGLQGLREEGARTCKWVRMRGAYRIWRWGRILMAVTLCPFSLGCILRGRRLSRFFRRLRCRGSSYRMAWRKGISNNSWKWKLRAVTVQILMLRSIFKARNSHARISWNTITMTCYPGTPSKTDLEIIERTIKVRSKICRKLIRNCRCSKWWKLRGELIKLTKTTSVATSAPASSCFRLTVRTTPTPSISRGSESTTRWIFTKAHSFRHMVRTTKYLI